MKKLLSLLMVCFLVFPLTVSANINLLGDINGDSQVNLKDSFELRKYLAQYPIEIFKANADINFDGQVNTKDSLLLRMINADYDPVHCYTQTVAHKLQLNLTLLRINNSDDLTVCVKATNITDEDLTLPLLSTPGLDEMIINIDFLIEGEKIHISNNKEDEFSTPALTTITLQPKQSIEKNVVYYINNLPKLLESKNVQIELSIEDNKEYTTVIQVQIP